MSTFTVTIIFYKIQLYSYTIYYEGSLRLRMRTFLTFPTNNSLMIRIAGTVRCPHCFCHLMEGPKALYAHLVICKKASHETHRYASRCLRHIIEKESRP